MGWWMGIDWSAASSHTSNLNFEICLLVLLRAFPLPASKPPPAHTPVSRLTGHARDPAAASVLLCEAHPALQARPAPLLPTKCGAGAPTLQGLHRGSGGGAPHAAPWHMGPLAPHGGRHPPDQGLPAGVAENVGRMCGAFTCPGRAGSTGGKPQWRWTETDLCLPWATR